MIINQKILNCRQNHQILGLVKGIADRMRNPDDVEKTLFTSKEFQPDLLFPRFFKEKRTNITLGRGLAGILILMAELDRLFPNENWDEAAHLYVLKIKDSIETHGVDSPSLYSGVSGVSFAIRQASRDGSRYQKFIRNLDEYLIDSIQKKCIDPFRDQLMKRDSSPNYFYDIINGLSGIGLYGLITLPNSAFQSILINIIQTLVDFTLPVNIENKQVPGWYVHPDYMIRESEKQKYPNGNFNLGLSHGIPGVLAFLAIASLKGVVVERQRESIEKIATWLMCRTAMYKGVLSWKTHLSLQDEIEYPNTEDTFISRDAWCYGAPGIASALLLASKALQDDKMKKFAIDSLCSVFTRTQKEWVLPGPTFCHGISGLLFITSIIGKEYSVVELLDKSTNLIEILLSFYREEYPFGFKNFESLTNGGHVELDDISFLEGASGILLTLLSLHRNTSWWDAPFLVRVP